MPATPALAPGQSLPSPMLRALGWPSAGCRAAVLLFVRGSWCPVCRRQITRFAASADEFTALGVPLFVISTADSETWASDERLGAFAVRYVTDDDGELITTLGIAADHPDHGTISRPATVVIDPSGSVKFAHVGTHSRDRPEPAAILLAVRRMQSLG